MKNIFLKIISIAFIAASPFLSIAQTTPSVTFNGEGQAVLGNVAGCDATVILFGRILLGPGTNIDDAVVYVAYMESPINASYEGVYQQAIGDFDSGNNFYVDPSGFIPGHTYYFLFKTGIATDPQPAGFVPDFSNATLSIQAPGGEPCPGGSESTDPGGGSESGDPGEGSESGDPGSGSESVDPSINFLQTSTINNPLDQDLDILGFIGQLFENFVKIALPILVLFTVWAGLQFVMARGNEEKLSDAKKNFFYVIIGAAIIFGAWGLANILAGTVAQFEAFNNVFRLLV